MQFDSLVLPSQAMTPLGVGIGHLILGLYLARFQSSSRDDPFMLFVIYLGLSILWSLNLLLLVVGTSANLMPGISWVQVASYGLVVLGSVYWAFARAFLQLPWRVWWGWAIGAAVLLLAIVFDGGLISLPAPAYAWSNGWIYPANIGFTMCVIGWAVLMSLTLKTVHWQQRRTQSPAHRNRIQFLLIATILLLLGYSMYLSLVEPFWTAGLLITWLGSALTAYVVVVEDLIDLSTALRRTVGWLVTIMVTVAVYIAGIYLVQIFLGDLLASSFLARILDPTLLVAAATAVLLTVVYIPIQRATRNLTNKLIFGQSYNYQRVIQTYAQTISNILYLDDLATASLDHINNTFGINHGGLFLLEYESPGNYYFRTLPVAVINQLPPTLALTKETPVIERLVTHGEALAQYTIDISAQFRSLPEADREILKAMNLEWFVPIRKKGELIGVLGLGPKISQQRYTTRDILLLQTLADQTALALENASLVDRLQRNLEETNRMKNLMNNVFDSMQSAVVTTDLQGRITFFNKAATSILRLPGDNTIGKPYTEAMPGLASTIFANLVKNVIERSSQYTNYEIISELSERGRVNLNLNLAPLKNAQEQVMGVAVVMDDITETKRLQAVHDMFRRYVSPAVVDRLPADPSRLELGGHRQLITVLFADIRGFTEYSEYMEPEKLVDTLNEYLSMAASAILMYEGTLDKFVGDAIMGIFNAPLQQEDHVQRAVRAALAMQRSIREYHKSIGQDRALSFGIGLHMGEAVVGNVGMSDRMDYTAIGDTVNLAKRIQENTPGNTILMSQAVYDVIGDGLPSTFYKKMTVKGREQPVVTYELTQNW